MPDPITPDANPNPSDAAPAEDKSLLDGGTPPLSVSEDKSILDAADAVVKEQTDADNKRILEAKEEDLSPEDLAKKPELLKAQADAKAKEEADAKAKVVPEKYEFKAPEGMTLDIAAVEKVTPLFKELKLTQEQAQKLVDVYATQVKSIHDAQAADFAKFVESEKQATIKALGANYKEELSYAAKFLDKFANPKVRELFNGSGLGNNIEVIKMFIQAGKLVSEGKLIEGKVDVAADRSAADILYDKK